MVAADTRSSSNEDAGAIKPEEEERTEEDKEEEELENLRQVLKCRPEDRSDEQVQVIMDFIMGVPIFAKLPAESQRNLANSFRLEVFYDNEIIIQRGELGDKFYMVMSGSVYVKVPDSEAPCPIGLHSEFCKCCEGRPEMVVSTLHKQMGFGELALQNDAPRSATVQSVAKTEVLTTTRKMFLQHAGQMKEDMENRMNLLRRCPGIEEGLDLGHITSAGLASLATIMQEDFVTVNGIGIQQGSLADKVVCVASGKLALVRAVEPPAFHEGQIRRRWSRGSTLRSLDSRRSSGSRTLSSLEGASESPLHERRSCLRSRTTGSSLTPTWGAGAASRTPGSSPRSSMYPGSPPAPAGFALDSRPATGFSRPALESRPTTGFSRPALESRSTTGFERPASPANTSQKRALQCGVLGPCGFYGQQFNHQDTFPVSFVGNPFAETFIISKRLLRSSVPRKLAIIILEQPFESLPSDLDLLHMSRHSDKWSSYRDDFADALPRELQKEEFTDAPLEPFKRPHLNTKDVEIFSSSNAGFLHRFNSLRQDKGVRRAMARTGAHWFKHGMEDAEAAESMEIEQRWTQWSKRTNLRSNPWDDILNSDDESADAVDKATTLPSISTPRTPSTRGAGRPSRRTTRQSSVTSAGVAGRITHRASSWRVGSQAPLSART